MIGIKELIQMGSVVDVSKTISIILPAKNESAGLPELLAEIKSALPEPELVVVNDGSTDDTQKIAEKHANRVVNHPYSMGNGAAVKSGARAATGEILVFMDADGQHSPSDIPRLLEKLYQGFDMVIGARKPTSQASIYRRLANTIYNKMASLMTGRKIDDLTSGFRAVNADKFRQFLYLLPNGFSYPTTITMAFLRSGYPTTYIPIEAQQRSGKSNISPFRDGSRFLLIILKVGSLFSPMRLFFPISLLIFITGAGYYAYTYITAQRFTNMSAVLFLASLFVFLIGIISEQISSLHYQASNTDQNQKNAIDSDDD